MDHSLNQVVAWATILSLAGGAIATVVGWFLHQKDKEQETAITTLKAATNKELERLDASLVAAWLRIEILKDERSTYLTRVDFERWRSEMRSDNASLRQEIKADMVALGNQLVLEISKMSADIRSLADKKADK